MTSIYPTERDGIAAAAGTDAARSAWLKVASVVDTEGGNIDDMFDASGCDYTVHKSPTFETGGHHLWTPVPSDGGDANVHGSPVTGTYGRVRKQILAPNVGAGYAIIQNRDATALAAEIAGLAVEAGEDGARAVAMGSLRDRQRFFVVIDLPDRVIADEGYGRALVVTTGHDGATGLTLTRSLTRFFCTNQLTWYGGQANGRVSIRHTGRLSTSVEAVKERLGILLTLDERYALVVEELANEMAGFGLVRRIADRLWPVTEGSALSERRHADRMLDLELRFATESAQVGATRYAAFQTVTGYHEHQARTRQDRAARAVDSGTFANTQEAICSMARTLQPA